MRACMWVRARACARACVRNDVVSALTFLREKFKRRHPRYGETDENDEPHQQTHLEK